MRGSPTNSQLLTVYSVKWIQIQLTRTGALTGGVYVPGRYIHSGMEMVDLKDVANTANLLAAMIMRPDGL